MLLKKNRGEEIAKIKGEYAFLWCAKEEKDS